MSNYLSIMDNTDRIGLVVFEPKQVIFGASVDWMSRDELVSIEIKRSKLFFHTGVIFVELKNFPPKTIHEIVNSDNIVQGFGLDKYTWTNRFYGVYCWTNIKKASLFIFFVKSYVSYAYLLISTEDDSYYWLNTLFE